jgi:hypothetical protein
VPSQNLDKDEEAFIMAMIKSWEEGKAEARAETLASDILTVLRVRNIAVPDGVRDRILAQRDMERLEHWLEKAVVASSAAEVFGEPS